jgi:hypothetical protein
MRPRLPLLECGGAFFPFGHDAFEVGAVLFQQGVLAHHFFGADEVGEGCFGGGDAGFEASGPALPTGGA